MRMIGIGLLAFLIAGAASAVTYFDIWARGLQAAHDILEEPQLVFGREQDTVPSTRKAARAIIRAHSPNGLILSGFPAYQSASFSMPIDTRPTSGHLQIDATFQVLEGVEGALRVSINNTRRAEVLLRPGEAARSLQIVLTQQELAGERLVVSFSLLGHGAKLACGPDGAINAIVEIETTSGVFLTLATPLRSVRDRVITWGHQVHIAWPPSQSNAQRSNILAQAAHIQRHGYSTRFVDQGDTGVPQGAALAPSELIDAQDFAFTTRAKRLVWPTYFAKKGPNAGVRRFQRSTSWRVRYDLDRYQDYSMPDGLNLRISLGPPPAGAHWTLTTTFNARLIDIQIIDEAVQDHALDLGLPAAYQDRLNVIEITVTSSYDPDGLCNHGPELIAEIRAESHLWAGGAQFENELQKLRSRLANHVSFSLKTRQDISASDAQAVARLLANSLPTQLQHAQKDPDVFVTVLSRKKSLDILTALPPNPDRTWLVYLDEVTQVPKAHPVTPHAAANIHAPVALLITIAGAHQ